MLVNLTGKPGQFRAVDWLLELINLYTKVSQVWVTQIDMLIIFLQVVYGGEGSNHTKARIILESILITIYRTSHSNIERNFVLAGLTHTHAGKDMAATFKTVLQQIAIDMPNENHAGRSTAYIVPNVLAEGAAILQQESGARRGARTSASEEAAEENDGALREEDVGVFDDAMEVDDDLEVEVTAEDLSTECDI